MHTLAQHWRREWGRRLWRESHSLEPVCGPLAASKSTDFFTRSKVNNINAIFCVPQRSSASSYSSELSTQLEFLSSLQAIHFTSSTRFSRAFSRISFMEISITLMDLSALRKKVSLQECGTEELSFHQAAASRRCINRQQSYRDGTFYYTNSLATRLLTRKCNEFFSATSGHSNFIEFSHCAERLDVLAWVRSTFR